MNPAFDPAPNQSHFHPGYHAHGTRANRPLSPLATTVALFLFLALQFVREPFVSNQHTYFLHAVATASHPRLAADPIAQSPDPLPLFTALATLLLRLFDTHALIACDIALTALTYLALRAIAQHVTPRPFRPSHELLFASLLGYLHFAAVNPRGVDPTAVQWAQALVWGFGGQPLIAGYFQPASFGALLLIAIALTLTLSHTRTHTPTHTRTHTPTHTPTLTPAASHAQPHVITQRHTALALAITLGLAVALHPTFLLPSLLLLFAAHRARLLRATPWHLALAITLALAAPSIWLARDVMLNGDPAQHAEAARILVHERIPHHALPWLNWRWLDNVRIATLVIALYLTCKHPLSRILSVMALGAALGTALVYVTQNDALALLFPARAFSLLIPIATATIIARLVTRVPFAFIVALFAVTTTWHARYAVTDTWLIAADNTTIVKMAHKFARQNPTTQRYDTWLVPPEWESFRLMARVPIYADWKSHPFAPDDLLAWHRRVADVREIYTSEQTPCTLIDALAARTAIASSTASTTSTANAANAANAAEARQTTPITQLVVPPRHLTSWTLCDGWQQTYSRNDGAIWVKNR